MAKQAIHQKEQEEAAAKERERKEFRSSHRELAQKGDLPVG